MADPHSNSDTASRRRSWQLLGLLIAAHAGVNIFLSPFGVAVSDRTEWLMILIVGAIMAQPVLFAAWAVLGPPPAVMRVPLTVAALGLVLLASGIKQWNLVSSNNANSLRPEMLLAPFAIFAVATIVMLLVRRLTRWQIALDGGTRDGAAPVNHFSLKFLLVLTMICAVLLAAGRGLVSGRMTPPTTDWLSTIPELLARIGLFLLVSFPAIIVPLVILISRPAARLLISILLLWSVLGWLTIELVAAVEGEQQVKVALEMAPIQLGAVAAGVLSALVVRYAGYRLVSTRRAGPKAATVPT